MIGVPDCRLRCLLFYLTSSRSRLIWITLREEGLEGGRWCWFCSWFGPWSCLEIHGKYDPILLLGARLSQSKKGRGLP